MKKTIFALAMAAAIAANAQEATYSEQWRPQYHFTPAHRWIGDPCGLVHFDGKFHAYSWGAAESDDLVHWKEINHNAINSTPKGISQFTGSVVVDKNNTAGYGENAFIAAFTSFDEQSKKQSQSIAFSLDSGATFQYYDLNPVIDTWSTEFRDPTVIWDETTQKWIMLVAKALEKKVAFYGSADFKHWDWLSDFGPMGDNEKSWECPDMFLLPVQGTDIKKWVLLVSVNWAREQYFVGDFDGVRFIPDVEYGEPLYVDSGLDYYASRAFQDYDGTLPSVYSIGWVSTWDYAQQVPTAYGKGVWSLPRELTLKQTPDGLRLVQTPAQALKELRGKGVDFDKKLKPGTTPLPFIAPMDNQYELHAQFTAQGGETLGLNLCSNATQHVALTYDSKTKTLALNRMNATNVEIPKFERVAFAKIEPEGQTLTLDVYVDKSVIEIYANGGECVMTALAFPDADAVNAEATSTGPNTSLKLTAYPLASIWRN